MQPEGTNAHTSQFSRSVIFLSMGTQPGDANCMIAGVHVPQGAKLTRVAATYESGVYADPFYRVTQVFFGPDTWREIARFNRRVDNSGKRHTTSARFFNGTPRVDNTKYNYVFEFCMGYKDVFYGARVFYEYSNAGD